MKFQITLADTDGKAVIIVETPQELWDALASATEPAVQYAPMKITMKVNRVITLGDGQ